MSTINNSIRFVAIGFNVPDGLFGVEYGEQLEYHSPYYGDPSEGSLAGAPRVIDLAWLFGISKPGTFRLQSKIKPHIGNSQVFSYSESGGLLIGSVISSDGFSGFSYIGPT